MQIKLDHSFLYDRRRGPLVVQLRSGSEWIGTGCGVDCDFITPGDYSQGAVIGPSSTGNDVPEPLSILVATKFSYEVVSAKITSVQESGSNLKILFRLQGNPAGFGIEVAQSPEGQYRPVESATYSQKTDGEIEATLPIESERQFYRVIMR